MGQVGRSTSVQRKSGDERPAPAVCRTLPSMVRQPLQDQETAFVVAAERQPEIATATQQTLLRPSP